MVKINFLANPAPEPSEVIWHFVPTKNDSEEAFSLESGTASEDGKYNAKDLKVNDNKVVARMVINTSMGGIPEGHFHLEVSNIHGSQNYAFDFPHLNQDQIVIIAVVIAVILGVIALGILVSGVAAKKNEKFCFRKAEEKDSTSTKSDLVEIEEGSTSAKTED